MIKPNFFTVFNANATGGGSLPGPAHDMQTSTASGQLVIGAPEGVIAGYYAELVLEQAPTISGPWIGVPSGSDVGVVGGVDAVPSFVKILSYIRSERFLRLNQGQDGAGGVFDLFCFAVEPAPPLVSG